jgi:protein tyrosine phosphatase (PTP) superfamily phosphohydrolase (DUF442 family)
MKNDERVPLRHFEDQAPLAVCFALLTAATICLVAETNEVIPVVVGNGTNAPIEQRSKWARKLERRGLPNLHQVTTNLYRGAQPTAQGMAELKAMGVTTIINLRTFHTDKDELAGTGLKSVRFRMQPWDGDDEDVVRFLKIVSDTNNLPAFVHCQRGADRTGMMCAMYRIALCGWTKQEAIEEMKEGGFAFSPAWKNLVRYIEKSDVEKLKRKAGIVPTGKQLKP